MEFGINIKNLLAVTAAFLTITPAVGQTVIKLPLSLEQLQTAGIVAPEAKTATFPNIRSFHDHLVGTWTGVDPKGRPVALTFKADLNRATVNYFNGSNIECFSSLYKGLILPHKGELGFFTSEYECGQVKFNIPNDAAVDVHAFGEPGRIDYIVFSGPKFGPEYAVLKRGIRIP